MPDPGCTRLHRDRRAAARLSLAVPPPAPLAMPQPAPLAVPLLPKDRNARRTTQAPLAPPHDTSYHIHGTCKACGHVWKKDSITIRQCGNLSLTVQGPQSTMFLMYVGYLTSKNNGRKMCKCRIRLQSSQTDTVHGRRVSGMFSCFRWSTCFP